jgi:hypothetical protein
MEAAKHEPVGSPVDQENKANNVPATEDGLSNPSLRLPRTGVRAPYENHRRGRRSHTGQIFGTANHQRFGLPVDQENKAKHGPATEDGLSNPSLRLPRTGASALLGKITGEGVGRITDNNDSSRQPSEISRYTYLPGTATGRNL